MSSLDILTAELDSLLEEAVPSSNETLLHHKVSNTKSGDGKELFQRKIETRERDEKNWGINVESDISEYISDLNDQTELRNNYNNGETILFPSDLSKNKDTKGIIGKVDGKNKSQISQVKLPNTSSITRKQNGISVKKPSSEYLTSDDLAIKTIVDLSKKVRDLNCQLSATQNKLRLAEAKIISLKETQSKEEEEMKKEPTEDDRHITAALTLEKQIKELTEKLTLSNSKLCEARNQIQQQKHEIKLLQKAVTSEIGESASLTTLSSEGWRGRAQQILSLQQKVTELNEKLSQASLPASEKASSAILLLEKTQDKERIATLTKELEEARTGLGEWRAKTEAARARVAALQTDLASLRNRYDQLVSKNDEDVKLVNTLATRISNISQKCQDREKFLISDYEEKLNSLNNQYQEEKLKSDQLKKIVIERDSKIDNLEGKLKELRQNMTKIEEERPPSSWSTFQEQRPPSRQSSFGGLGGGGGTRGGLATSLPSTEIERLRLMELVTVLNKRLDQERQSLDTLQEELRLERHRSVRLQTKCSRLEVEKAGGGRSGYSRRSTSSGREGNPSTAALQTELATARDRMALLEEKILALESRLTRLKKEKEEDSRIYVRMVEEAREKSRQLLRNSSNTTSSNISLP